MGDDFTVGLSQLGETEAEEKDPFGAPLYWERKVLVENVLITPIASTDQPNATQLYGTKEVYELSIPKGDTHIWDHCRVEFWGKSFRVLDPGKQYQEELLPLDWGRKVQVERYG